MSFDHIVTAIRGVYFISIHHPLHAGLGHFYYPAHIVFVVLVREDGTVTSYTC